MITIDNYRDVADTVPQLRPARLLRSAAPRDVSRADSVVLRDLGVNTVIDLRSDVERADSPTTFGYDWVPTVAPHPTFQDTAAVMRGVATPNLTDFYRVVLDAHGMELTNAVSVLGDAQRQTLVHCMAGKDRTGLVVALALGAVGVADEMIVADYALTEERIAGGLANRIRAGFRRTGEDLSPELDDLLTKSPAGVMVATLGYLRDRWGSAREFLIGHGMKPDYPDRLRDALLR